MKKFLYGTLTVLGSTVSGTLLGGIYAKFLMPKRGMGWDQIADALGALMIGSAVGLLVGVVTLWHLPRKR
ncbi:hypothetical protein MRY87_03225 [bacterium]|nr:hypothetical protein [bacterium]